MSHTIKAMLVVAGWTILALSASARLEADQITQIRTYDVITGNHVIPVELSFNQFDSTLGTLFSAEFAFQFQIQGASIDFENFDPSPASTEITIGKVVNFIGPGLLLGDTSLFDAVDLFREVVNFGAFDGAADFAGSDSFAFRQADAVARTFSAMPTSLAAYIGSGMVPLELVGILGAHHGTPPILNARINSDRLLGVAQLTYDFSAASVPESSTLSLASIGIAGLLLWRRNTIRSAIVLKPSTLLRFHRALQKRRYHFGQSRRLRSP